ncbi:MAG: Gfo/Idh/MocA family oxidoreductase [Pseudomonadota bacterium]
MAERDTAPFGVALIGLGMVAGTHARALAELAPDIAVRGVLSRSPDRARAFAADHALADARIYQDVAEIAADADVDAAIVLTPPNARIEIVEALAAAGKHLLLEKPVERTTAAAAEIVRRAEDAGVTLGIVFQHRMREGAGHLRQLLAEGALGQIGLVEIDVPWWRDQSYYDAPGRGTYARDGGGVLISQAIHTLDLVLSLAGPVAEVQAMAATTRFHRMEAEDFVAAGLTFASGAVGALGASTASFPGGAEGFTLHGEAGSATLRGDTLTLHWRDGRVEETGATEGTGGGADPMAFPHGWHRDLIADFAEAARTGRPPVCPGREALRVHALIDALTLSAREGRRVAVEEPGP